MPSLADRAGDLKSDYDLCCAAVSCRDRFSGPSSWEIYGIPSTFDAGRSTVALRELQAAGLAAVDVDNQDQAAVRSSALAIERDPRSRLS